MKIPRHRNFLNAALIACAALFGSSAHGVDLAIPLGAGWNLLGNTGSPAIDVTKDLSLSDSTKVTTVWKWNAQAAGWVFYAPSLAASGTLATYAAGKGYQVLSTIEPGEGFWVNAAQAFTLNRTGITPFTLGPTYTGASGLVISWNLVATNDALSPPLSPSQIDTALGGTVGAPSFSTMWAWSNSSNAWYFYAPSLAANSTLPAYIISKQYLDFATLPATSVGLGFWLNSNITAIQVGALTVSVTGAGTVSSTTAGGAPGIGSCTTTGTTACSGTYPTATAVALTATPAGGSTFTGWSGGGASAGTCSGTTNPCTLAAGATGVTATFTVTVAVTVPGAPTIGTATGGRGQASVSFTAPANNGGATITSYTASSNPGGLTGTGAASPIVVIGLTGGTTYTFTVTATNSAGTGLASAASNSVKPTLATAPSAPTGVTATAGNAQATVSFAAAANNGSAITGYKVTSSPAGGTDTNGGTTGLSHVITGLTNGTAYTFKVKATNSVGTSTSSAPSNSVTPAAAATVPGAPTIGTATAGNAQATVTFTAPASSGGSAITGYTVTSTPGGFTATGAASPLTVTGLANSTAYTFTVTATNGVGTSTSSAASNSVTPAVPTLPGAPTIGTATAGNAQATVTFTAPASSGGSAITGYTVTSTPGGFTTTGAASPLTVTGLANSTAYTFTVTATNGVGTSTSSAPSNSVTPSSLLSLVNPLILFTDITSGPTTGGENNNGIYLSIFGKNLGNSGLGTTVKVYLNNVEVIKYLVGMDPVARTPLASGTIGASKGRPDIQQITVQVGSVGGAANLAVLPIRVAVNGVDAVNPNNLTFTVNAGNIFFVNNLTGVDTTGTTTGGTFSAPFRLVQNSGASSAPPFAINPASTDGAWGRVRAGDFIVMRGTGTPWTDIGLDSYFFRAANKSGCPVGTKCAEGGGTTSGPITLMGYPGEDVFINNFYAGTAANLANDCAPGGVEGSSDSPVIGAISSANSTNGSAGFGWYINVVNLRVEGGNDDGVVNQQAFGNNWRVVNNELTASTAVNNMCERSGGVVGAGFGSFWVGNHIHDIMQGTVPTTDAKPRQNHAIYIGDDPSAGTAAPYEIAYNLMENITGGNGFQIHVGGGSSGVANNVNLHHNIIHDVMKHGINIADGAQNGIVISNNVIYNTFLAGIRFGGTSYVSNLKLYNNTFYNTNTFGTTNYAGILNEMNAAPSQFDIRNNIFVPHTGTLYSWDFNSGAFDDPASAVATNNLWFGGTNYINGSGTQTGTPASTFSTTSVATSPVFVSTTPGSENLRLQTTSNAKDAGTGIAAVAAVVVDDNDVADGSLTRITRPQGSAYDIGAYEFH